ncbi:hypothetical protein F5Y14DRAFT_240712 [Nemania sp. NC0429]|nr:hypothetical protein F5Y14DRAFT_240712 [Nemania sp. NC0429]
MKSQNPPDERVVYVALKNVFRGSNAEIRQLKAVRKLVAQRQNDADVSNLIKQYKIDTVCSMARVLLVDEVFQSTLKAKIRFPELFDVSPAQGAKRKASEAKAALNEAIAIREVAKGRSESTQNLVVRVEVAKTKDVETCQISAADSKPAIPSLFPVYLPLRAQHRILTSVQFILEDACFEFAQRAMPDILERNKWDCSEAAELNIWAAEFLRRESEFSGRQDDIGKPLPQLFRSLSDIRNAAVHRIGVSARGLEQFLLNAESLATLLGDTTRLKPLSELRRNIQQTVEELERNKHLLGSKLKGKLDRIAAQRAELDRAEEMAVRDMIKEDGEYQAFAGKNLEETVVCSPGFDLAGIRGEDEASSSLDGTEDERGSSV